MQTDLTKGVIEGRTLKDWWENSPYGAFKKKCDELNIPLFFSDSPDDVLSVWDVEIEYSYRGRGVHYMKVEAFTEKDAEAMALKQFDDADIDPYDFEITDAEATDARKLAQPTKGSLTKEEI